MARVKVERGSREDVVGLDIGDGVVAATRLALGRDGRVELRGAGLRDFDPESSEKQLAAVVKGLWREAGFSTRTVCTCLRSRALNLKYFRYPDMSENELASALALEAEESLQLAPEQLVLDWHMNRGLEREDPEKKQIHSRKEQEGILVALPRRELDQHLGILDDAGLYPVVVDVACMAVSNLFLALRGRSNPDAVECIVNLARRYVDAAILFGNESIYPRTILTRTTVWEETAEYLIANIKDALKFYQFKLRQSPVQKLIVCGRVPSRDEFVQQLGEAVGLPVKFWNPFSGLEDRRRHAERENSPIEGLNPLMVPSLGMALRWE